MKLNLSETNFAEGAMLLIDKPQRWSSFDVVGAVRRMVKIKKVGHSGTLDPLATGLLIICTGKWTKKLTELTGKDKVYAGTFTIGHTTNSYDLETEPQNPKEISHINDEDITNAAKQLTGKIIQIPPHQSALKQDGKPLYQLALEGKEIKIKEREVEIFSFEITKIEKPVVHFKIHCSTGTYIRTIANDFGNLLGTGAYLSSLVREKIGEYSIDNSYTVDELATYFNVELKIKGIKQRW